MLARPF